MSKYIPVQDSAFSSFVAEFVNYTQKNNQDLKLSEDLVGMLSTSLQNWNQTVASNQEIQIEARKSTSAKKAARIELEKWVLEAKNKLAKTNMLDDTHRSALKLSTQRAKPMVHPVTTHPVITIDFSKK